MVPEQIFRPMGNTHIPCLIICLEVYCKETCVAQSAIQLLISAEVMISQFPSSGPSSDSALTARSLLRFIALSFSLCLSPTCVFSPSQNKSLGGKCTIAKSSIYLLFQPHHKPPVLKQAPICRVPPLQEMLNLPQWSLERKPRTILEVRR